MKSKLNWQVVTRQIPRRVSFLFRWIIGSGQTHSYNYDYGHAYENNDGALWLRMKGEIKMFKPDTIEYAEIE